MGNANFHNLTTQREALMNQLNSKFKHLFSGSDFKDIAPFVFEEKFEVLAKKRL